MADVFISYDHTDQESVRVIAMALEGAGYSVWWDTQLAAGARYTQKIREEISVARHVVVVWSHASIDSDWVKDEAALGRDANKLLPLRIDATEVPLGFGQLHTIDLTGWAGNVDDPAFQGLLSALGTESPVARSAAPETPSRKARALMGLSASVAVLLAAVAGYLFLGDDTGSQVDARPASVAVLPFANNGSEEQRFLSDGIADEIIMLMQNVEGLQVTARTSSFLFRDRSVDVREIGNALGVAYVLDGSVRKQGDELRISAQLIDAETGFGVLSLAFDRTFDDVFAIQREVALGVLEEIQGESGIAADEVHRVAIDVYEEFLRARALLYEETPASVREAKRLLDALVAAAPADPRVQAALARAIILSSDQQYGDIPLAQAKLLAQPHIDKAMHLAPTLGDAYVSQGLLELFDGKFERAIVALERGRELSPGDSLPLHWLYFAYNETGEAGRGRRSLAAAAQRDPLYPPTFQHYGFVLADARPVEVQALMKRFAARWPNHPMIDLTRGNMAMRTGRLDEAHEHIIDYCAKVGNAFGTCAEAQINIYYQLELYDELDEVSRRAVQPPLLDAFLCPVKALLPIGAMVAFRGDHYPEAAQKWLADYQRSPMERNRVLGGAYIASAKNWDELAELLEPFAADGRNWREHLIEIHPSHERFGIADLAMARKAKGDTEGAMQLLARLKAYREEMQRYRDQRLFSTRTLRVLDMSIAAVEGDRDATFAAYQAAFDAGFRFRGPSNEPLLMQWQDRPGFRALQEAYDSDIARMRANVVRQLASRPPEGVLLGS